MLKTCSLMALLATTLLTASHVHAIDQYQFRFEEHRQQVDVRACFAPPLPGYLQAHSRAGRHTRWVRHRGEPLALPDAEGRLPLPALATEPCVEWQVDLGSAAAAGDYRLALASGDALLVNPRLWFWLAPGARSTEVSVDTPAGMQFSSPWPAAGPQRYRPVATPHWWSSRVVLGRFEQRSLDLPGGVIQLALAGEFTPAQADTMAQFVQRAARAVTPVLGRAPRGSTQVIVVPIGARSEAVPWAQVVRGGGPAVELYVDPARPLAEFDADWTATHEFSHFLLPYVAYNDRWLSEGLASYYQNVLRARDGRLSEREAWQRLHDGFERGRRATRDETLGDAARGGRSNTMRVYWAGAALLLSADVRLRERSAGRWSLDSALRAFNDCCVEPGSSWRARALIQKLDDLTGLDVFAQLHREQVQARRFPDLDGLYAQLGLRLDGQRISLSDDAGQAGIRRAIMSGSQLSRGAATQSPEPADARDAPLPRPGDAARGGTH